ncbi:MAG: TonB-dependent receptor [Bacteroidetes bacterium]|nr:MAG: TonB-dependent receptor [Bacteroidota bacterium]
MKQTALLIVLISFCFFGYSQKPETNAGKTKIIGKVVDSATRAGLEYATISLTNLIDKKNVNGAITTNSGNFTVDGISDGKYRVTVECIGYNPTIIDEVEINGGQQTINLRNIALEKSVKTLETVKVTAGKLIENKIDKLVYNAEKDISSQTGVATDILKKVPMVSVDVDGNVELAGSGSVRFLINGKPSTAFGSNINDVLQAIPASQIKSIEVITNPGAKYDAQGLGGIINIILKKSNVQGINSNLSLSAGTRNENGSFNFNAKKGKWGVNAFLSGNLRPTANTPFNSSKQSLDTTTKSITQISQDGSNDIRRHGWQAGTGFDGMIGEKNSITGSVSFNNFGFNANGSYDQSQLMSNLSDPGSIISATNTFNDVSGSFTEHNIDAMLNYKRTFSKEDQELEFGINTSNGKFQNSAANDQYLLPGDSLIYGRDGHNHAKEGLTEFTVDYVQPFGDKVKWGMGSKIGIYDIKSNADVYSFQSDAKDFIYDSSLSITMDYHQKVYAVYTELSFPIGKLFTAKVGGRYERTVVDAIYSNVDSQVNIPSYGNFVPSFFITRQLSEKQNLRLSYSKRIGRPDYGDLNPFINTSDPNNISMGNPYLRPEISQRFELSYNRELPRSGSLMVTLFYRMNKDDIQPFVTYYPAFEVGDTTYNNVYVTTRENIGIERNSGVSIFGDVKLSSKLSLRSNIFFFYRHTINAIDAGYNSNSFNYRFNANLTYQFTPTLSGEFFGNFNSARHEAQGKYPSFTSYTFAGRKQLWNKKASIALTLNNIFSEYVSQTTELKGPNFTSTSTRKVPFRSIGINFTWKFGRLEFKKDREEPNTNLNTPSE